MMDWFIILRDFVAHKCVEEIVNIEEKQGAAMTIPQHGKLPRLNQDMKVSWTAFPVEFTRKCP